MVVWKGGGGGTDFLLNFVLSEISFVQKIKAAVADANEQ